jgi:hypothetical protein
LTSVFQFCSLVSVKKSDFERRLYLKIAYWGIKIKKVELGSIELPSGQSTREPSTCLVTYLIYSSVREAKKQTQTDTLTLVISLFDKSISTASLMMVIRRAAESSCPQ